MRANHQVIDLHGRRFSFWSAGSGPLVLLLHGIGSSSATWDNVIPRLAPHCEVIAPDLLGHGDSGKPPGDYSLGAHANWIRDLLGVLGRGPATVVGHSLGGGVALQFAYQFPERCDRLVLVSSGGLGPDVHPLLRAAVLPGVEVVLPWLAAVAASTLSGAVRARAAFGLEDAPALTEAWRCFVSLREGEARRAFLATARSVIDWRGQRVSALDKLYLLGGVPTLIVWGGHDALIPVEHGRRTHELIAGSRLEIFPEAGHLPFASDPQRFAEVLIDFMRTTRPARAPVPDRAAAPIGPGRGTLSGLVR